MSRRNEDTDALNDDDDEELDPADADLNDIVDDEFEGLTDDAVEAEGEAAEDEVIEGAGDGEREAATDDELDELLDPDPRPRNADGTFAPKAKDAPADAGAEAAVTGENGAPAAGSTTPAAAAPAAAAAAPTWEPLTVTADKEKLPIGEAQVTRADGHVLIAVKEDEYNRFQQRMSKGVVAEKIWRQLHEDRQTLEAERAAPQPKSDSEIEAAIILEAVKPHLETLFDERDLEMLELKIENAKTAAARSHGVEREKFFSDRRAEAEAAQQPGEDEQALYGIRDEMMGAVTADSALQGMTETQVKNAFAELARVRRAVFWKEGTEWFSNRELIHDTLKRHMAIADAPPVSGPPASSAAVPAASPATTQAERFNRGVDSGAKPRTTSLKAKRGTGRPRDERPSRNPTNGKRVQQTDEQANEDKWLASSRKFMSSPGLDFEDDDDDA